MKRVSLRKNSGLGLTYSANSLEFNDVTYAKMRKFDFAALNSQLLNDTLHNVNVFYEKYYKLDVNKIFKTKNIKMDLVMIPSDVAGIEYLKTKAIRCTTHNKIVEIIYGGGIILIQKFINVSDQHTIISNVKATDKILIPAGYSYILVNNKSTTLITLEFVNQKGQNRTVLDEMKGMSYYIIKKNAKKEIVKNPAYRIVDKYKKVDWQNYYKKYNVTPRTPILRQLLRKADKFDWFFKPAIDSDPIFSN